MHNLLVAASLFAHHTDKNKIKRVNLFYDEFWSTIEYSTEFLVNELRCTNSLGCI